MMKKILFPFSLTILLWLNSHAVLSQALVPDSMFQSQAMANEINSVAWLPDGTAYCTFNGDVFMFVWTPEAQFEVDLRYYPYVYKYVNGDFQPFTINNTQKLTYGYDHEDEYNYTPFWGDFTIYPNAFAFEYYGRLWFYSLIRKPPNPNESKKYFELWARFEDESTGWTTWYTELDDLPVRYKVGACQVDSTLQLFSFDSQAKMIFTDKYLYDEASGRLAFQKTLPNTLMGDKFGGAIVYRDTLNNDCLLYSTYEEGVASYLTYFNPQIGVNILLSADPNAGNSTIIQGSIEAQRQPYMFNPEARNMFSVFKLTNYAVSDKSHALWNEEWSIPDNPMALPALERTSMVVLPSSSMPQLADKHYALSVASYMVPHDYTTEIAGYDGMQQVSMVYYPDSDKKLIGACFNSDFWRPVPGTLVASSDLADEIKYGPQIRSLWTLVGITDGAPPCSIDWPVWTSLHTPEVEPTELTFKTENVSKTEVTSTYEDSYSAGAKISASIEKVFTAEASFKYTHAYKSKESSGSQIKTTITSSFGLNEESQEIGYYLWLIPSIRRIGYQVYPCWDANLLYPITNSLQYQFRTTGNVLQKENIEISQFPFGINEPNAQDLHDWTIENRSSLYYSAISNDLQVLNTSWTAPTPGGNLSLSETTTQTSSVETTNTYQWGIGATAKVPDVFKLSASVDQDISYSTENVYETEFGTELEVSLKNLITKSDGINISSYNVSVYWFKPNEGDWWYLDSLDGQSPWYIAYTVGEALPELELLSPGPGTRIRSQEMLFSWRYMQGELHDYKFFIADAPLISPASTLYRQVCGDKSTANPADFIPEPGKTYYWAVRGMTYKGEAVWSESRAFSLEMPGSSSQSDSGMKVNIYPNPVRNTDIYISFELQQPGKVNFTLYDCNRRLIMEQEETFTTEGTYSRKIDPKNATSGIYFLVITSDQSTMTKKLVILK